MNLLNRGQTAQFSKLDTGLTVPKNHKTNIAQNNLQHQIFLEKEKKKRIEDYGRKATNLLLAYASASASASSLFVEKLWKETAVCLKTVEEITKVERGGGCWES